MADTTFSRIPQNVWSNVSFAGSSPLVQGSYKTLFTSKIGDVSITLCDTNIKTAGKTPYVQVIVYGIQAEIYQDGNNGKISGFDLATIRNNMSLTISKNTIKRVFAMLHNVPGGNDTIGPVADGTAITTIFTATNGTATASNYYAFKVPEIFTSMDQLDGQITIENGFTPTTDCKVRITLLAFVDQAQGVNA